jgi:hypothetical protein
LRQNSESSRPNEDDADPSPENAVPGLEPAPEPSERPVLGRSRDPGRDSEAVPGRDAVPGREALRVADQLAAVLGRDSVPAPPAAPEPIRSDAERDPEEPHDPSDAAVLGRDSVPERSEGAPRRGEAPPRAPDPAVPRIDAPRE